MYINDLSVDLFSNPNVPADNTSFSVVCDKNITVQDLNENFTRCSGPTNGQWDSTLTRLLITCKRKVLTCKLFHVLLIEQLLWRIVKPYLRNFVLPANCMTTFSFRLLEAFLWLWEWFLTSESRIYRFYDKKVVIYHPLSHKIEIWKLLVTPVVINSFKSNFATHYLKNLSVTNHLLYQEKF